MSKAQEIFQLNRIVKDIEMETIRQDLKELKLNSKTTVDVQEQLKTILFNCDMLDTRMKQFYHGFQHQKDTNMALKTRLEQQDQQIQSLQTLMAEFVVKLETKATMEQLKETREAYDTKYNQLEPQIETIRENVLKQTRIQLETSEKIRGTENDRLEKEIQRLETEIARIPRDVVRTHVLEKKELELFGHMDLLEEANEDLVKQMELVETSVSALANVVNRKLGTISSSNYVTRHKLSKIQSIREETLGDVQMQNTNIAALRTKLEELKQQMEENCRRSEQSRAQLRVSKVSLQQYKSEMEQVAFKYDTERNKALYQKCCRDLGSLTEKVAKIQRRMVVSRPSQLVLPDPPVIEPVQPSEEPSTLEEVSFASPPSVGKMYFRCLVCNNASEANLIREESPCKTHSEQKKCEFEQRMKEQIKRRQESPRVSRLKK